MAQKVRYSGTLTFTAPMAIRLWETFTFIKYTHTHTQKKKKVLLFIIVIVMHKSHNDITTF